MRLKPYLLSCLILFGTAAVAGDMVNKDDQDVAISGYDPVAYHTAATPTPGDPEIRHSWNDAIWQFASAENRDLFASDPERYAPRFGGFCAGAMAFGRMGEVDPHTFVIIDGELFLGGRDEVPALLSSDPAKYVADAAENWKTLGQTN